MSVSKPRFERGMDMEAGMWSGLPFEILEQVLAFVPVPDLCRYRAVCKAWDHLISDPEFAARHKAASMSYIVMSYSRRFKGYSPRFMDSAKKKKETDLGPWCILDVHARRWYTVGYHKRHQFMHDFESMAMEGGLVCQYLETKAHANVVIVRNPIASDTARLVPVAWDHIPSNSFRELCLAVDVASAEFKVILINHSFNGWRCGMMPVTVFNDIRKDPPVRVYESATKDWRTMCIPPWVNAGVGHIRRSIMLRGWLYVLFGETECPLWRYDVAADLWERLATPFSHIPKYPELVVSDQRLFLAAWYCRRFSRALDGGLRERKWFYKLFEVKDFEKPWFKVKVSKWETVFDHSRAKMVALFEDDAEDCDSEYYHISLFGCGSCLLFMSNSTGKAMTFDVATRTWDRSWPQNPLGDKLPEEDCSWVGEHMNLLLPSMRW